MNISLPRELKAFIARQVKSGRYRSADEVVDEALRLLQERDRVDQSKLRALRAAIKEGLASPTSPLEMEQIIARARERRAARRGS